MKLGSRIIFFIFIIFMGSIFFWAINSPKQEISERIYQTIEEQKKRADLIFKDVTFEEVVAGVKYWELTAKQAVVNKSAGIATLKEASGTFFKQGRGVLHFQSPVALWDMKNKEILLDKPLGYDESVKDKISLLAKALKKSPSSIFNLRLLASSGYWFQAKNLSWKMADQKLICTGKIIINKGQVTGYAEKLEGDVGLENIVLEGNPRIIISSDNSSPITLEAAAFEVKSQDDTILAKGSPRILWKEAKINADKMEYFQRKKTLALKENVKINYNDIEAWGESANYFTDQGLLELKGMAQAKQGENKLKGDTVLVSLKDQKISVLGSGKVIIGEEDLPK